ncbi:hypothetical protein BGZ80_008339 [Entomortierella chlamydospora]|uniref:Uncharacterized protein n=1 Tax=Entomortierella chlamydospora TaxID=101097 RepID=A0A9P6T127_9FUNG|nr:hypothetical protein BGZ80_008339 [Entomortierella chlamydospora]
MDSERGFGSKLSHHHRTSSNGNVSLHNNTATTTTTTSTSSSSTTTINSTIHQHQHQHQQQQQQQQQQHQQQQQQQQQQSGGHSNSTSTSSGQHARARSHSHSQHTHYNIGLNNTNINIPPPSSSVKSAASSAPTGILGGSSAGSSFGILKGFFNSSSLPSIKDNIHHSSSRLDQLSRSISSHARRFFRSNGVLKNVAGTTRRVRFGVLLPVAALTIWLIYVVNAFLFRLVFGSGSSVQNPYEPVQPPTWIDRGDITDLDMRPTEGTNMTTAILLNWSRLDSLKEIVNHLCPHVMFKEIMIWNNKVDIHLEEKVNMHACFSWLGTGAMATRESVVNFLKQASVTGMDSLEFAYGDMYFSTFLNQVPYQLENYLMELVDPVQDMAAFSRGSEGKTRNKIYMHKAAQKLWDALARKDPAFEREELHPNYLERDVRSPCADDRCLIISNKHPFPDVKMFKYRPYIDIEEIERIHTQYEDPTPYVRFPFSKAVDGMDDTAYKSTQPIAQGDYIGLDMLLEVKRKFEFRLLYQMGDQWIKHATLEVAGSDAVYRKIPFTYSCKDVRNPLYNGDISLDTQRSFLNQPLEHRIFDTEELVKHGYIADNDQRAKKPVLSFYEDYGWRTQCKFVVNEASGFRFMRLVSGRNEKYPFVIYDLGWKVI